MAVRIRKDGRIFCAALRPAEEGDTYIDDDLHYQLSVEKKVLVAEPWAKHKISAEWWWAGNVPKDIVVDDILTTRVSYKENQYPYEMQGENEREGK